MLTADEKTVVRNKLARAADTLATTVEMEAAWAQRVAGQSTSVNVPRRHGDAMDAMALLRETLDLLGRLDRAD